MKGTSDLPRHGDYYPRKGAALNWGDPEAQKHALVNPKDKSELSKQGWSESEHGIPEAKDQRVSPPVNRKPQR